MVRRDAGDYVYVCTVSYGSGESRKSADISSVRILDSGAVTGEDDRRED